MNAGLANGSSMILVSDRLRGEASVALCSQYGLHPSFFGVDAGGKITFGDRWPFPPADTIIALVADQAESLEVARAFGAPERTAPPILIKPSPTDAVARIVEIFLARRAEAAQREASLREQLCSMRLEAEETRAALRRLRAIQAPLAPQRLSEVCLDTPAAAREDIAYRGSFDFNIATRVEIFSLTAVSLLLAAERLVAEDRLEIALLGEEKGEVVGTWTLPGLEIPRARGWLTLDLPVSLALAKQTAGIRVRGRISGGGVISFARSANSEFAGKEQVALRLYTSSAPRLGCAPFWNWTDADTLPTQQAPAMPAHCWLDATVYGASFAAGPAHGEKRLRLRGQSSALMVFPDVPVSGATSIAIRLRSPEGDDITAAVALLPSSWDRNADPSAASTALCWSPLQTVTRDSAVLSLAVPKNASAKVQVVVALHDAVLPAEESAVVICEGAWLLRRAPRRDLEIFAIATPAAIRRDTDFEEVRLDEIYADDNYRHLDMTTLGLSEAGQIWRAVKFKLFEEQGTPGVEFRSGADLPECFSRWPGTQADRFGPYFKLSGADAFARAMTTLPEADDRRLLAALEDVLPSLMRSLIARGDIRAEDGDAWLAIARRLRATSGGVDAV